MRRPLKIVLPLALIALSLAAAGYLRATKPAVEPRPLSERIWSVRAQAVQHAERQPTLRLYGEVVAGRDVVLRPLVAGEVVEVSPHLVEGGRLQRGELVLAIDRFEYQARIDELQAQRREAQARRAELLSNLESERAMLDLERRQVDLARRDLERRQRLRGSQAASEKALDDAQMVLAQREAALAKAEQTIAMLGARIDQQEAVLARLAVALGRARRDLEHTRLEAPFAGLVGEVEAAVGKRVSQGDRIARLIDEDRLEIRFTLADTQFGRLWRDGLIGREIEARWRLGGTIFEVGGRVVRVGSTIDPTMGGVDVFAAIEDNPTRAPLRPGAFVEVLLPDRRLARVVELPASAVHQGRTVYVVDGERLVARNVEVLARDGNQVLLKGDLFDGDAVVTSRLAEIGAGLRVQVTE